MRINDAFRARLYQLYTSRNLTVTGLAKQCGITQSTLNNITSGRNISVTLSTIQKICDGLEISIIDFFDCELFFDIEQEIY